MRALITNDDGIDSAGLRALAFAACRKGLDVVIAAPAEEASGSGTSIIATESSSVTAAGGRGHIRVEKRQIRGLDVPTFAVHAAPALIALVAAHGAFGAPPGVVLSGVNRGANVGRSILHSGTVGAALTGASAGARALAVSLATGLQVGPPRWLTAMAVTERVLEALVDSEPGTILNLNVPNKKEVPSLVEARLAPFGMVQTTVSRRTGNDIHLSIVEPAHDGEGDTDTAILSRGHATLTRLRLIEEAENTLPELGALSGGEAGEDIP